MALALLLGASAAHANGRFPRGARLLENPTSSDHLVLGATYGLLVTTDHGRSWSHICEAAFGGGSWESDPLLAFNADGRLVAGLSRALSVASADACEFVPTLGRDALEAVPDFTLVRGEPNGVLAVHLTLAVGADPLYRLSASHDGGDTWAFQGQPLPSEAKLVLTVDVAPSDPQRIYLTALGADGGGLFLRSKDGGETFATLPIASDAVDEAPYIAAVSSSDPDVVYVRTDLWQFDPSAGVTVANDALLYTTNAGDSFTQVLRAQGKLLAFALSPQEDELLLGYGDPVEGGRVTDPNVLGIYRTPVGAWQPEHVFVGAVSCLTWTGAGLYACVDEGSLGYALGFASDPELVLTQGQPFTPALRLASVGGPLGCSTCSSAAVCAEPWLEVCEGWGRTDCALADSLAPLDCSVAGAPAQASGGADDSAGEGPTAQGGAGGRKSPGAGAGGAVPGAHSKGSGGCRLQPGQPSAWSAIPMLLLALGAALRFGRRRERFRRQLRASRSRCLVRAPRRTAA